jgi:hypothetical protein
MSSGGDARRAKRLSAQRRFDTGGTSPGTPGDPLSQMARCAKQQGSRSLPAARAHTARAGRPSAAVRLRAVAPRDCGVQSYPQISVLGVWVGCLRRL